VGIHCTNSIISAVPRRFKFYFSAAELILTLTLLLSLNPNCTGVELGVLKMQVLENTSVENVSTKQDILH